MSPYDTATVQNAGTEAAVCSVENGIKYYDLEVGSGAAVSRGDTVTVRLNNCMFPLFASVVFSQPATPISTMLSPEGLHLNDKVCIL
jgi:hypothetical protein